MVPETVIRAIAAAPQSEARDTLLGSLGLTPALTAIPEKERLIFAERLSKKYQEKKNDAKP